MKAQLIELEANKTYKTRANAIKAVDDFFAGREGGCTHRYFITVGEDGRFFPVFIGQQAVTDMLHFRFNVVA